jgi:hypothetical protein
MGWLKKCCFKTGQSLLQGLTETKAPVAIIPDTGVNKINAIADFIANRIDAQFGKESEMYWGDSPVADVLIDDGGEPRREAYYAFLNQGEAGKLEYQKIQQTWESYGD